MGGMGFDVGCDPTLVAALPTIISTVGRVQGIFGASVGRTETSSTPRATPTKHAPSKQSHDEMTHALIFGNHAMVSVFSRGGYIQGTGQYVDLAKGELAGSSPRGEHATRSDWDKQPGDIVLLLWVESGRLLQKDDRSVDWRWRIP